MLNNNSYAWCLRYNIFSAWFLDIRIYQLVNKAFHYDSEWLLLPLCNKWPLSIIGCAVLMRLSFVDRVQLTELIIVNYMYLGVYLFGA